MGTVEITARDGEALVGSVWHTPDRPRTVVQIAHGASEHIGRYDRLARALAAAGHAVIGADHRGHGRNAALHGLGNFGPRGFAGVVDDMAAVADAARHTFDAPIVLLAHSMGSFAAQAFLAEHPDKLDGLVLSGTAALEQVFANADPSAGLAFFNGAFEPARTPFDWLSRDTVEVDAYIADPLCGFEMDMPSQMSIGAAVFGKRADPRLSVAVERNLPIYVISGEVDPIVGPAQAYSRAVVDDYRAAGFRDIEHRIYPGGRHEMFNETNRDEVIADLIGWLAARFAQPGTGSDRRDT